jgi:hypothetical protein
MAWALSQGYAVFIGLKMGLTGLGAWVLATYQHIPLAYHGLHALLLVYVLLCAYYAVIFW